MFTEGIDILRRYRLEESLSYEQLGARINAAGFAIRTRTLHLALTGRTRPRDTTLYKLRRFVDHLAEQAEKKAARATARPSRRRVKATAATAKRKKPKRAAA